MSCPDAQKLARASWSAAVRRRFSPYLKIAFFLLATFLPVTAAPTWRWSNPAPHGATIYDITSRGSLVAQVGEFGQVFTSDDLDEWAPRNTGVQNSLRSALFFGSRLVITASNGLILYTDTLDRFTTVDLGSTDWLEGIAASATRLIAVGDNGAIYTSTDGASWQREANAGDWLTSVAFGNNRFVAVGSAGYVTSSPDGLTWTATARITASDLNKVAWLGDRFWAIGNNGDAFTSATGTSWSSINVGTTNDLFGISFDGTEIVLAGRSELRSSATPFTTWTSRTGAAPAPPAWTYFAAWFDGAETLVGGRSGMFLEGFHAAGSSTNSWLNDSDVPRNWIWSLTHAGEIYAACGERGGIFTSTDGFRFDQEVVPTTALLEGIGGTSNLLVSVGASGTILYSQGGYTNVVTTDSTGQTVTNQVNLLGLIWHDVSPSPTVNELQGVGVLGDTFIITGANGTILTSADGRQWTFRFSGAAKMLSGVATSPTRAVVVGDRGTILTSDNATTWTARASGVTNWIYGATYANNQYVAIGETGLILTSPDAISWTRRTSGTTRWLNTVAYANGNYYAGGTAGTLLTSPDAITWTALPYNTTKSIYGIAQDSGRLLLAGLEGATVRTRLLPWESPVNFLNINQSGTGEIFLFSGELDQRFMLQRTVDFKNWFDAAELEILDNSGADVYFQGRIRGNLWFFRTSNLPP